MNCPDPFRLPAELSETMSAYTRLLDGEPPGRVRGLYLVGSVALGDFRPGRSDVDFVAVSDTFLEPSKLGKLRRVHTRLRRIAPTPALDGIYLTWSALAMAPVGLSCSHR